MLEKRRKRKGKVQNCLRKGTKLVEPRAEAEVREIPNIGPQSLSPMPPPPTTVDMGWGGGGVLEL